jgi:hypothetical protein
MSQVIKNSANSSQTAMTVKLPNVSCRSHQHDILPLPAAKENAIDRHCVRIFWKRRRMTALEGGQGAGCDVGVRKLQLNDSHSAGTGRREYRSEAGEFG